LKNLKKCSVIIEKIFFRSIIRKINKIGEENLKRVLKETIILSRIKTADLIQGITKYFIEEKQLFLMMPYRSVFNFNFSKLFNF
jgi:hypothetical protein